MERNLKDRPLLTDPDGLPRDWHPIMRRVYAARGIASEDEIDPALRRLHTPRGLLNASGAAELIAQQVVDGGRILVVGDFDADGATSCAVAVRALRAMGALRPDYLVPNRFDYGYGLSPEIVAVACESHPDLIITVDNGISSVAGVRAANDAGVPVIVTDHHLPGREIPDAAAIVNPNLPGDTFASKCLAGVGVIFLVISLVRSALRDRGWFDPASRPEPNLAELLDLVALGTVADVVPLDGTNRVLVEQGLRRIRAGRSVPGIRELLTIAGREPARAVAADLAFAVAPRLNAAGRLEDMTQGIECLLAAGEDGARELALGLDRLNRQRRWIEERMREDAMASAESLIASLDDGRPPAAFCLTESDWHQGVIGIVASRIKEHFHRPVIAFAPAGEGELKGSARSIPGLHMRDALEAVSTQLPGLIPKFGGHAMAAGLSLQASDLETFREAFAAHVRRALSDDELVGTLYTDGPLAGEDIGMPLALTLRTGGPWGQGFPEPVFANRFRVHRRRIVGERHVKLTVSLDGRADPVDAIAFSGVERGWDRPAEWVRLAYRLDVNEYRGRRNVQLLVEHLQVES